MASSYLRKAGEIHGSVGIQISVGKILYLPYLLQVASSYHVDSAPNTICWIKIANITHHQAPLSLRDSTVAFRENCGKHLFLFITFHVLGCGCGCGWRVALQIAPLIHQMSIDISA